MSLSRQHYVRIAEILARTARHADRLDAHEVIRTITSDLADYFSSDNLQFDRERFFSAVYKEPYSVDDDLGNNLLGGRNV